MKRNRKMIRILCIILVFVTAMMLCVTIATGKEREAKLSKEQYETLEKEALQELKDILNSYYLNNSGVMLTKTRTITNQRQESDKQCDKLIYEIQIHNKGLSRLSETQLTSMQDSIAEQLAYLYTEAYGLQPDFEAEISGMEMRFNFEAEKEQGMLTARYQVD